MSTPDRQLVVGRFRKPHGLKGEVALFPLTDDPASVFAEGRSLWVVALDGDVVGGPLEIERSREYHREWLVKFRGVESREHLEPFRAQFVAAPASSLAPPADGEVYLHELEGFAVQRPDGTPLGIVTGFYELPGGITLEVQGQKREFLLPFRKEFVVGTDRAARKLVVEPPEGLVEEAE
jgi:16S rRNA processing protein RimM